MIHSAMSRYRPGLAGFAFLLAFSLLCGSAWAQDAQPVPGTSVTMVPPENFTPASAFSGFENQEEMASILIVEMPAQAYEEIRSALFSDVGSARKKFASKGIAVTDLKTLKGLSGTVRVVSGTQEAMGVTHNKWVALVQGEKTVMITVQAPQDAEPGEKEVFRALASVRLGGEPSREEKLAALPFTVKAAPPFRIVNTVAGSSVLLTAGELDVDPQGTQPLVVVATQLGDVTTADPHVLAKRLLAGSHRLENARIEKQESVRFAGGDGILLAGRAADGRLFRQYLTVGKDRYIRMVALMPADTGGETQAAIDKIAASAVFREN